MIQREDTIKRRPWAWMQQETWKRKNKKQKVLRLKWSNFQTKKKPDPTPVTLNIKHGEIKKKEKNEASSSTEFNQRSPSPQWPLSFEQLITAKKGRLVDSCLHGIGWMVGFVSSFRELSLDRKVALLWCVSMCNRYHRSRLFYANVRVGTRTPTGMLWHRGSLLELRASYWRERVAMLKFRCHAEFEHGHSPLLSRLFGYP